MSNASYHGTTILAVKRGSQSAIGGDGQVTLGSVVMKGNALKIRSLASGAVLCGFAGSAADAFALLERYEKRLAEYNNNIMRAAIELAKEWRTDRVLRRLESMMIVIDRERQLLIGGNGDVIEPEDGILAIGSGGSYATAAARALLRNSDLSPRDIVQKSLEIAGELCIYTNNHITIEAFD